MLMSVKIYFDMDGTVFDLYGKQNWLEMLRNEVEGAFIGDWIPEINKHVSKVQSIFCSRTAFNSVLLHGCQCKPALNMNKSAQQRNGAGLPKIFRLLPSLIVFLTAYRNKIAFKKEHRKSFLLTIMRKYAKCGKRQSSGRQFMLQANTQRIKLFGKLLLI